MLLFHTIIKLQMYQYLFLLGGALELLYLIALNILLNLFLLMLWTILNDALEKASTGLLKKMSLKVGL